MKHFLFWRLHIPTRRYTYGSVRADSVELNRMYTARACHSDDAFLRLLDSWNRSGGHTWKYTVRYEGEER